MENLKQILICDDDEIFRTFFQRVLKTADLPSISAGDGDEAIDILDSRGNEISLVVVDLLMPVCSGWEVIEFMQERDDLKTIPVIAITGLEPTLGELKKIDQFCASVVHKGGDFDIEKLLAQIKKLTQTDKI